MIHMSLIQKKNVEPCSKQYILSCNYSSRVYNNTLNSFIHIQVLLSWSTNWWSSEWVLLFHQDHSATNSWNTFRWCIGAYKTCSLLLITCWQKQRFSSSNTVYLFHTPFPGFHLTNKNHWLLTVFTFYDSVPNLPVGDWWYAAISLSPIIWHLRN